MPTHRYLVLGAVALALSLCAAAQEQQQEVPLGDKPAVYTDKSEQQKGETPTIQVNVKLVDVYVTVVDGEGAPVGGLVKDNFQLSEDGVPQVIRVFARESELPLSIVMAIDASLSTRTSLKLELESARRFIHSIMRRQDALSLYQFAEQVTELVHFTSNLPAVDRGIDRVHVGSATALYDAVYLGSQALESRQGRKVLVVITDGGDTVSQVDYAEALRAAQESEALVYSIIIVPVESSAGRNTGGEHALIQMSNDTGGKYYYAHSLAELDTVFQQISDQLRTQYLLGYYPQARISDSDFRRIEVRVLPAKRSDASGDVTHLVAHHRTGYYTSHHE
jgi:Ca-activated chloride channel family protein